MNTEEMREIVARAKANGLIKGPVEAKASPRREPHWQRIAKRRALARRRGRREAKVVRKVPVSLLDFPATAEGRREARRVYALVKGRMLRAERLKSKETKQ